MSDLTPMQLFEKLSAIAKDLPRMALAFSVPCKNCDCGLKDSVQLGLLEEKMSESFKHKAKDCEAGLKASINFLLNHPSVLMAKAGAIAKAEPISVKERQSGTILSGQLSRQ